ncbi:MAG: NADH:ubiquinone oxidoreductase [bacterium]|nr:NADH:ubiquinone oxidoreductase [bacterium]
MKYLSIEPARPKVAVFDFTDCEGCELQLINKEETLVDFLKAIEVVNFREAISNPSEDYDIAFVEGSISRADEIDRLLTIRKKAKVLVAFGTCACFGGVHKLKNVHTTYEANKEVYGDMPKDTMPVRSVGEIVQVDFSIPGCPVSKAEIERIVQHLIWDVTYQYPVYPVCFECRQRFTICRFDLGELCLGPVSAAGCNAPCPAGGMGCWGCRGVAEAPNFVEYFELCKRHGYSKEEVLERMNFFGGFAEVTGVK